jgi:hypothetical protein
MSVIPLPLVAQDDVRDRAVRLFTFLREYTQLRASTAQTTDAYDEVIQLDIVRRLRDHPGVLVQGRRAPASRTRSPTWSPTCSRTASGCW